MYISVITFDCFDWIVVKIIKNLKKICDNRILVNITVCNFRLYLTGKVIWLYDLLVGLNKLTLTNHLKIFLL